MIVSNLLTALTLWRFFVWGNITDRNLYCPHQERKGTFGVSDMRGMWVFFCGLYVCLPVRAIAGCATGYAPIINAVADAIMAPMLGECEAGYRLQEVPDEIMPANGHTDAKEIPVCDGYWTGTTCNPGTSSDCPSGQHGIYYDHVVMAPMLGGCEAGFKLRTMPDGLVVTNGYSSGDGIALAETTYTQGDCPDGYVDLAVNDDSFFKVNTSGSCTNGYKYTTEQCKTDMPNSPMICGILCESGFEYTEVGTCAELCPAGHNSLRTSTGLAYPMYATKSVTPSINLRIGETVCYVNLISGTASNSLNIKYNNKLYHAVK